MGVHEDYLGGVHLRERPWVVHVDYEAEVLLEKTLRTVHVDTSGTVCLLCECPWDWGTHGGNCGNVR
ncbi:hypothetical protein F2Q68_00013629 [Brassica cretica]|uniref:Uncharacterized protein n=1 Tax=Brassica cretica TaxID=69181 RepID=A0A8S9HGC5_BRACR|nr:hypothetical protein F2Q68_00013629 [Brassica cretica]